MAITYSPSIVTNGLVCYYDMSNTQKSWKGAPTTNYVPNADTMPSWTSYNAGNDGTFITEFGTTGYQMLNRASWNGIYKNITVPSAGTYTFSAWVKYAGGSANNNGGTVYVSGWGGGDSSVSTNKTIGSWQRLSITLNCTTTTFTLYLISFGGTNDGISDKSTWYVTMPQVEAGSIATPFVAGTRSSTQAILDLMNNNTVTATSLTYAANNTFSFNGSSNRITITCGTSLIRVFNSTTEFIINLPTYSGGQLNILSYRSGGGGNLYIGKSSGGIYAYYNELSSPGYTVGSIANGTTAHCAVVCDATNSLILIYINGVLAGSASRTGFVSTFATSLSLGYDPGGTAEYMLGSMYQFKHYNRVLSAAEIAQNFNATRSRYGI